MNKFVLCIGLGVLVFCCNSKSEKINEEIKSQAMTSCENAASQPNMSPKKKALVKEYCNCATDKMVAELSYIELMQMNNPSKELQSRLIKLVEPCLAGLKTKSAEIGE